VSGPLARVLQAALGIREYQKAKRRACPPEGRPRVFYGRDRIPLPGEHASGGIVKFQHLQGSFPNSADGYNTLYLLSSSLLPTAPATARGAAEAGARIFLNQNGVAFPAWHGEGYEQVNRPMREILRLADCVLYQSRFCKESADRYLGAPSSPWKILYNPVDTDRFRPAEKKPAAGTLVLLAAGSHWQSYRVTAAVETLALLRERGREARLLVAGRLLWKDTADAVKEVRELASRRGVADGVELTGPYSQDEAPEVMKRSHILLHAKCNDPCPGVVLEAMASGLPVVYSASGGTPELVGAGAGVGVPSDVSWEKHTPPDPGDLCDAVLRVDARLDDYSAAAAERARSRFAVGDWIESHRLLFEGRLEGSRGAGGREIP
jgi:glycosyltransferase involved in cell wall biosynthesis